MAKMLLNDLDVGTVVKRTQREMVPSVSFLNDTLEACAYWEVPLA